MDVPEGFGLGLSNADDAAAYIFSIQHIVPYFADMLRTFFLLFWIVAAVSGCWAAPTVQIFAERPSPQPVGTVIGISAVGKDEGEFQKYFQLLRYRFSVAGEDGTFHIVRDFSRSSEFAWMPGLYEHETRIKVTVVVT